MRHIKRYLKTVFVFCLLMTPAYIQATSLNVFACEPEWASLVNELGGSRVNSTSATNAFQDPHHIEARPSLIAKVRNADLVICSGAELETGWLPMLLKQAANHKVLVGKKGYFEAAVQVIRLDIPVQNNNKQLDRSQGDIHASGNPHVHLDPRRIQTIANALSERLIQLDTTEQVFYQQRLNAFSQRWQQAILQWERRTEKLKNKRVIVHHRDWVYLFDWLKIDIVAALEPKPGLPTTAGHLSTLKNLLAQQPVHAIIHTPYQNPRIANRLSQLTTTPVIELPYTVGGTEQTQDLFALFDSLTRKLVDGIK